MKLFARIFASLFHVHSTWQSIGGPGSGPRQDGKDTYYSDTVMPAPIKR